MIDFSDMYNQPDDEVENMNSSLPTAGSNIKIPVIKGAVTELEIEGKRFELVNPEYIRSLQNVINVLNANLQRAERNINTLNGIVRKLNQEVKDVGIRLDKKIDRI